MEVNWEILLIRGWCIARSRLAFWGAPRGLSACIRGSSLFHMLWGVLTDTSVGGALSHGQLGLKKISSLSFACWVVCHVVELCAWERLGRSCFGFQRRTKYQMGKSISALQLVVLRCLLTGLNFVVEIFLWPTVQVELSTVESCIINSLHLPTGLLYFIPLYCVKYKKKRNT